MRILLEESKHGKMWVDTDYLNTPHSKNHPENNPEGKTFLDMIKEDAVNGTDLTGWRKYIKVLEEHKLINTAEAQLWRAQTPNAKELPYPKQP